MATGLMHCECGAQYRLIAGGRIYRLVKAPSNLRFVLYSCLYLDGFKCIYGKEHQIISQKIQG